MSGYVSDCCGVKVWLHSRRWFRWVFACSRCKGLCHIDVLRGSG